MRRSPLRRWAALWSLLLVGSVAGGATGGTFPVAPAPAAAVPWAPSAGFLVAEVVTGGVTASDEFVELYNAAAVPLDLSGLELVYVTSSGSTVTRKAFWSETTSVPAGRHVLIANGAGVHAGGADATYTGGFAASGGAIALREVGGAVLDALAWGDAASSFVEGTAGSAPPAGSSLERLPGGADGNARDTNENAADTRIESAPIAQNLAAPATPGEVPTPGPTSHPTAAPSATPTTPGSAAPTGSSAPTLAPSPTPPPTPSPTPPPSATPPPTPTPAPTATPAVTPTPTPAPTASPTAAPLALATARAAPEGTVVVVEGVLTTPLGLVDSGDGAFMQDASAGIALYLGTADWPALPAGTLVRATGTLDSRFGQVTLRLADRAGVVELGPAGEAPAPFELAIVGAGETVEGLLVAVEGTVSGSPDAIADGFATDIDDGTGTLRVVVATATGVAPESLPNGLRARLVGVLGQRDSSGTGTAGYRLHLRSGADIEPIPEASPSPSASLSPSPAPSSTASPTGSPAPTASGSPAPTATPMPAATVPISDARRLPLDTPVAVRGTVVAEPGRIIDDRTFFITDATGGIAVHVEGERRNVTLERGRIVLVTGRVGQRYGNLEVRVAPADSLALAGTAAVPAPVPLALSGLDETSEGRLARISGIVASVDANASGSASITLREGDAESRVFMFAALGFDASGVARGDALTATGIVGQRASGTGRADGYRLWPRDASDLVVTAAPEPTATPGASPKPTPGKPRLASIADARRAGGAATVEGIVTAPAGLLDADGRRTTIQDASGAILVRLPANVRIAYGARMRVSGQIGTYFGASQLAADEAVATGSGTVPAVTHGSGALSEGQEWLLVRIEGYVVDLRRSGQDWRADVRIADGTELLVNATERAGIPAASVAEGATVAVTGLVRRPYPTATDRRFALLPRSPADVRVLASPAREAEAHGGADGEAGTAAGGTRAADGTAAAGPGGPDDPAALAVGPIDVTLDRLREFQGRVVRVGGEVVDRDETALSLDDGLGTAVVRFPPDAAPVVALVATGDVVNVVGRVGSSPDGPEIVAAGADALARVGALAPPDPAVGSASSRTSDPASAARRAPTGSLEGRSLVPLAAPPLAVALVVVMSAAVITVTAAVAALVRRRRSSAALAARLRTLGLDVPPARLPAGEPMP